MTIAFYFSMNAANIYVIIKDGMAQRALTVMMDTDGEELHKYFSQAYLPLDKRLATMREGTNPYEPYQITGIDHRLRMEWMWTWPWEDTARATITEQVPGIDGRIKASYKENAAGAVSPPRWPSARMMSSGAGKRPVAYPRTEERAGVQPLKYERYTKETTHPDACAPGRYF